MIARTHRIRRRRLLITHETDYAIRILRALSDGKRHPMKELCVSEEVPQQFAYKIIRKLADAGIIKSVRGVNGGCQLIRDLTDFSFYDLIQVTDPERIVAECVQRGFKCHWKVCHGGCCSVHTHLARIQKLLDAELKQISMEELFKEPNVCKLK